MDAIDQGLQISLYGITITFLALGLLILVISLLQVIFPAKQHMRETAERPAEPRPEVEVDDDHTRLVALTAAWWYWHQKRSSSLGKQLEQGPGKRWRKS